MLLTFDESRPRERRVLRPDNSKEEVATISHPSFLSLLDDALGPYPEVRVAVVEALLAWKPPAEVSP